MTSPAAQVDIEFAHCSFGPVVVVASPSFSHRVEGVRSATAVGCSSSPHQTGRDILLAATSPLLTVATRFPIESARPPSKFDSHWPLAGGWSGHH